MYDFTDPMWKPVPFASAYVCNRHGVIFNKNTGYEMGGVSSQAGHPKVSLKGDDGHHFRLQLNHLIASLFMEGYDKDLEIFYRNGDKSDISVDNLYQTDRGRRGARSRSESLRGS